MPAADQKDLIVIDPTSGKPLCRKDINLAVVHAGGLRLLATLYALKEHSSWECQLMVN